MKKNIFLTALTLTALTANVACTHEEDDIFEQSAAERLNHVSSIYSARLTDSKGGWVIEYYPYDDNEDLIMGVGYLITARFHADGSVFTGMKNAATEEWVSIPENSNREIWKKAGTGSIYMSDSSSWQVITDMGPVLSFNTYNKCFGRFSDPDDVEMTPSKYDDESGKGFQGDYEFVMTDVPEGGNHIMLKGKKRGIYQRMSRLPEGTDFETYLDDIEKFKNSHFSSSALWELTMTDNGTAYKIDRMFNGSPRIYPEGKDSVAYGWLMPYLVTKYEGKYHVRFKDTLMADGQQMEQEFYYDETADKFVGMNNSANSIMGADPTAFFIKSMKESHLWSFDLTSDMEGEIASRLQATDNDFKAQAYSITQLSFSVMDDFRVKIKLKKGKNSVELTYLYDMQTTEQGLKVNYREPNVSAKDKASQQILTTVPSLITLLETFNGTYTAATATGSNFDLHQMKISNADNNCAIVMSVK